MSQFRLNYAMQINPKTTYLFNGLCKSIEFDQNMIILNPNP